MTSGVHTRTQKNPKTIYACDFETTVYDGQDRTDVWAAALVPLYTEDVTILHSIDEMFDFLVNQNESCICYFHNLKFDGSFWLDFLLNKGFTQAYATLGDNKYGHKDVEWLRNKDMPNNSFKYLISTMGQWYTMTIKVNRRYIEIRDSLKLLPFSIREIGKAFKTKHQKLEMEYKGYRYPGCEITPEEREYIGNDVLVLKEALEFTFEQGHNKLTIGACCLSEFKNTVSPYESDFAKRFPNLYDIDIEDEYDAQSAGQYLRKAYRGGWCYVARGKENKIFKNGTTADVNSLYPSMMHSCSGNYFPYGQPTFWKGDYIPPEALYKYFFVRIRTRFYIKPGKLPFIQLKNNFMYKQNECLESSDVVVDGVSYNQFYDKDGELHDTFITMTLTKTDFKLILEHYELVDCEILDGCWFEQGLGMFDEYIDKYKKEKQTTKGAKRTLAKLFLNNLYGKMATSTDSSFKVAYLNENGDVRFYPVFENGKKPGYIPVGCAITSYAREFTIRAAQKNYYGPDKPGFIYADTDSIHCDLPPEKLVGINVHESEFCCWKLESYWDEAIFTRQKTYIEHITHSDGEPVAEPYYDIKCAGMNAKCKELFNESLTQKHSDKARTKYEQEFVNKHRTLEDFKVGLIVPGKLMQKRIRGGVLLVETDFEMR